MTLARKSLATALAIAFAQASPPASAQEAPKVEKIEVMGSNIKRVHQERPATVTVSLPREDDRTVSPWTTTAASMSRIASGCLNRSFASTAAAVRDSAVSASVAIVRHVARWQGCDASITQSPLGGALVSIAW